MKFDWFLQEMPSLHRHNVIKHLKSQVVVLKKILVFLILVSVVVTCKTDKKDSIVQVNNELIKIVDRHFNTTDQNPYINDSTTVKIANEIADYLVKNKSPDNVLTNLKDSSITHVEKIDSLIYKFSFPLAYMKRYTLLDDRHDIALRVDSGLIHFQPNSHTYRLTEKLILDGFSQKSKKYLSRLDDRSIRAYYRQYIYFTDKQGDSIAIVNAFCRILNRYEDSCGQWISVPWDWKNKLKLVDDGGDCYWQTKINLTKKECIFFRINGSA